MTCQKCRAIFDYEEIQISSTEAEGHHVCKGIELCPLHSLTGQLAEALVEAHGIIDDESACCSELPCGFGKLLAQYDRLKEKVDEER